MKIHPSKKAGFTLVEIMIVVAIIGLLAAIALPNFVKARQTAQKNACIANLKQIDGAKEQYALENKIANGGACADSDVLPFLKNTTAIPTCPASGAYTVNTIGTVPTCDVSGHVLP
jgi:prepilin-type N-terminal cleavage/methylation domain-containing protein